MQSSRDRTCERPAVKVLRILRAPVGGIGKFVIDLCVYAPDDVSTTLVTSFDAIDPGFEAGYQALSDALEDSLNLVIETGPCARDLSNMWKIYRKVCTQRFDVIHGHGAKGGFYARCLGLLLRVPVVYSPHGGSFHAVHGALLNRVYHTLERILYVWTDALVCDSDVFRQEVIDRIGDREKKIQTVVIGIEIDESSEPREIDESGRIDIAAFGFLRRLKGHDVLIRSIAIVRDSGFDVHAHIYGRRYLSEGEYQVLPDLIQELGLEDYVSLEGETSDVPAALAACHIVVHPSRFEALSYVPLEAMNARRPVIVSAVGGLKDIVTHETNGYRFESENSDDLARMIIRMIESHDERRAMIEDASVKLAKRFDRRVVVDRWVCLYKELMGGRS